MNTHHHAHKESTRKPNGAGRQKATTSKPSPSRSRTTEAHADEVGPLMDRFGQALTAGDGAAIARMWDVPALMISDGGTQAVTSAKELEKIFSGAKDQYHARGIEEAVAEVQSVDWLTDRVALARVRWPYIDKAGREIGEESSTYTLRQSDDGALKIQAVVMHGAKTA